MRWSDYGCRRLMQQQQLPHEIRIQMNEKTEEKKCKHIKDDSMQCPESAASQMNYISSSNAARKLVRRCFSGSRRVRQAWFTGACCSCVLTLSNASAQLVYWKTFHVRSSSHFSRPCLAAIKLEGYRFSPFSDRCSGPPHKKALAVYWQKKRGQIGSRSTARSFRVSDCRVCGYAAGKSISNFRMIRKYVQRTLLSQAG